MSLEYAHEQIDMLRDALMDARVRIGELEARVVQLEAACPGIVKWLRTLDGMHDPKRLADEIEATSIPGLQSGAATEEK